MQLRRLALGRARRRPGARRAAAEDVRRRAGRRRFAEFKAIWDPDGTMNPGKVVDALPHRRRPAPRRRLSTAVGRADALRLRRRQRQLRAAPRCAASASGKCRRDGGGVDVPELHGHARREALDARPRPPAVRDAARAIRCATAGADEAVKEALDLCLACKGCKGDCPVNVDMATYKAEFLSHYYERPPAPAAAYTMGLIYLVGAARRASAAAGQLLAAARRRSPASLKLLGGIAPQRRVPRSPTETFRRWFRRRPDAGRPGDRAPARRRACCCGPTPSTTTFIRDIARAAVGVLEAAGFTSTCRRGSLCCGRPLYDYGLLDLARAPAAPEHADSCATRSAPARPSSGWSRAASPRSATSCPALFPHDRGRQAAEPADAYLLSEFLEQEDVRLPAATLHRRRRSCTATATTRR